MKARIVNSLDGSHYRIECADCGSLLAKMYDLSQDEIQAIKRREKPENGYQELQCRECKKKQSKGKNEVYL